MASAAVVTVKAKATTAISLVIVSSDVGLKVNSRSSRSVINVAWPRTSLCPYRLDTITRLATLTVGNRLELPKMLNRPKISGGFGPLCRATRCSY